MNKVITSLSLRWPVTLIVYELPKLMFLFNYSSGTFSLNQSYDMIEPCPWIEVFIKDTPPFVCSRSVISVLFQPRYNVFY